MSYSIFGGALTQPLSHRLGRGVLFELLFFILHIYFTKFFLKNQVNYLGVLVLGSPRLAQLPVLYPFHHWDFSFSIYILPDFF